MRIVWGLEGAQKLVFAAGHPGGLIQRRVCDVCGLCAACSQMDTALKNGIQRVLEPDKNLIKPSLNLAAEHLHLFSAKCAFFFFFFARRRNLSTADTQRVFMFGSRHKTSNPSLHTLDPLMRLIGAAFGLTLFGSFFIFLALSAHSKHRDWVRVCVCVCAPMCVCVCDDIWEGKQERERRSKGLCL